MARRQASFDDSKSLVGAALAGVGVFLLHENLGGALAALSHDLATHHWRALGVAPAAILVISQLLKASAIAHQSYLHGFIHQILMSCWPVLLIIGGSALAADATTGEVETAPKERSVLVELAARRSTLK